MQKPICKDVEVLSKVSAQAKRTDVPTAVDLSDTLKAHRAGCVGMAANMIGINKRIISVIVNNEPLTMMNPKITFQTDAYETQEGCLSLQGTRKTTRYRRIEVTWQDLMMRKQKRVFTDYTAQIIQHEMDHLQGILI